MNRQNHTALSASPRRYSRLFQIFSALVLTLFSAAVFCCQPATTVDALSKMGSRGEEVRTIQTKLIRWGYLNDKVDGIYGPKTRDAVIWFQKKNGLTVDGIAGPATLKAMGIFSSSGNSSSSSSGKYSQSDVNLLARIISAESRGEPYTGQVAVIYQKGAFTALTDGQFDQPVAESCYKAARDAMNGWDPSGGAIYYYNPQTATSQWIRSRPVVATIGRHVFCK